MTISASIFDRQHHNRSRRHIVDITPSSAYATGGDALTANQLGLVRVDHVTTELPAGYVATYDRANSKLQFWIGNFDSTSDGPQIELASASYPAALTASFRLVATGV